MRAIIIFLVAAGICFVSWVYIFRPDALRPEWLAYFGVPAGSTVAVGENILRYTREDLGIAFDYKTGVGGYALRNLQPTGPEGLGCSREFHLVRNADVATAQYSDSITDGAPQITILVCNSDLAPEAWATKHTNYSFFDLKEGAVVDLTLSGAIGVKYFYHGLFPTNLYVLSHRGRVYLISGNYEQEDSVLYRDFFTLLGTLQFTP